MSLAVPSQIHTGLSRTRTHLQRNADEIAMCVADMAKDPNVDLTDELERLTGEGDALRRKLAMYENAAMLATEQQHDAHYQVQSERLAERCEAAVEAAERRTKLAEQLDHFVEGFKILKQNYDQEDQHTRDALWQAASLGVSYQEAARQNIDGACRLPLLEEVANVLLRYHHEQTSATAAGAREIYVRSVAARLLRSE